MKNKFLKILSKPKVIIPIFAIVGVFAFIWASNYVGRAPVVKIDKEEISSDIKSGSTIDLSFPKSGRIESINATVGQTVHKGDVLVKLSAPDAEGAIAQAKGSFELAKAEYASLNSQYASAKKQQDLIVKNAYQTLLSGGLEGVPSKQDTNSPIISGTYNCNKEGSYVLDIYRSSDSDTGFSFNYSGLEKGLTSVKYDNPVALGSCGLQIKFKNITSFNPDVKWTIDIPNTKSSVYLANKNAYDLAVANREKILSDLLTNIGSDENVSVSSAKVEAARGAYEAALGAYQNNLIVAPADGVVSSIDKNLKVGQSVSLNKSVISITIK